MEEQSVDSKIPPTETPINQPSKKSSKRLWIIGALVIVVLLVALVGYKSIKHANNQQLSYTNQQTTSPTTTISQEGSNSPQSDGQSVSKSNTSNQQLDQDLQTIQGNLTQLNSDQGNANQAMQNQSKDSQQ